MLLSVADLVASRDFKGKKPENGINNEEQSDIWENIFTHLFEKCLHPHSEIRHSALHIFGLIFNNYGHNFSYKLWKFAFKDMFFEMLDNCLEVFLNLIRDKENKTYSIDTPKVVQELREKFLTNSNINKDQNNMVEHHSRITIDKHWEETMIHIIKSLTIISKKYLENNEIQINQEPITVKIFESYLLLLRISKYEIFLEAVFLFIVPLLTTFIRID